MKDAERELLCQRCDVEYPVWYCAHFLWKPVAEFLEKETGVPIRFLCLNCFATACAQAVEKGNPDCRIIWKLEMGSPQDARLDLTQEALSATA